MTQEQKEQKQLIDNTLEYYFNKTITKYDAINLVIAILNNKVDPNKTIQENLNTIKDN